MLKQGTRVLIAEDDLLVSEMIQGLVEDLHYQVIGKATNGRQAIDMANSLSPDVVLMDIEMPQMNGFEATRHICKNNPTPVVILTAYESPQLLEEASQSGAGAYLVKPPNLRQVERAIIIAIARFNDIIELRRLNTELKTRNQELEKAIAEVNALSGLLPICSSCKKIRDDSGYWQQVEIYISEHADVDFSHGLCPDCVKELYPDSYQKSIERRQDIIDVLTTLGPSTLTTIATNVGLPESNTLNRLQVMMNDNQVSVVEREGQTFYELPDKESTGKK